IDELLAELQRRADEFAGRCPQVSDAALGLITAINYDDEALVHSSFASLMAALAEVANDCIERELAASDGTQTGIREGWQKYIDKKAFELAAFEKLKDTI